MKKEAKPELKPDSETVSVEKTVIKGSGKGSQVESDNAPCEIKSDKDIIKDTKIESDDSVSAEIALKKDTKILQSESEAVSGEINIKKESKSETKSVSETVSNEVTLKKKLEKEKLEVVSNEVTLEKDSIKETTIKSDSVPSEIVAKKDSSITLKKDSIKETTIESDSVPSEIVAKKDSLITLKKDSIKETTIESDSVSSTIVAKTDSSITLKKDSIKETTVESDSVPSAIVVKKDSSITIKNDSEVMSSETNIKRDSESKLKPDSETKLSETSKKSLEKDSSGDSNEITLQKKSRKETKLVSDSASVEMTIKQDSEKKLKSEQDSTEENKFLLKSTDKVSEEKQISNIEEISSKQTKTSNMSMEHKDSLTNASTPVVSPPSDTHKDIKDQVSDCATLSVSKTDSSAHIPLAKSEITQSELSTSCELSKQSELIESQKSESTESLKHSKKLTCESTEIQLNIPEQEVRKDETYNVSSGTDTISKEQTSSDSLVVEVKPDIPKKTKQKSLDLTEGTIIKEEPEQKPSLPPKKSKRHSLTDSASASFNESLSSSSSAESIGSFESAPMDKSRKSSLKSSDETSMHSLSPDVPARRSRASKTSSSRSASRDSDDNSSCSRSSSLKIRRRSSNFIEPEPIDLSKKRASIDERIKKLQNEGKCTTKEKAFIAAKLIEMQFEEEDALLASRQCNTVYHAVKFLTQLCDMCNCRFPINLMSSLVNCTHRACKECLRAHFTSLIYDRSVFTLLCPICHKPDITDQNIQEYFTHLDMTLRNILEDKVYDLFQRKLRDEVLTKDPNFHWCSQCSSGFIASPRLKKLYCPDCSAITCAMCHQTWELEHEGVHCERFQQWKDMHTPEPPPAGLVKFLTDRGISCPSCDLVYAQACGGCLMYKCSHCSFEFCGFCIQPLKKGRECSNEICDSRGHHIHHLHNCLFFLRDKDITEIQMLLEEESVPYLTIPPKDQIVKSRCQVREQKNNHGVIIEDRCGRAIEPYCAGLCRTHYYEYLSEILRKKKISPLSIMTIQDLQFMLRKSRIFVPEKVKGETSEDYYERLLDLVTKSLT